MYAHPQGHDCLHAAAAQVVKRSIVNSKIKAKQIHDVYMYDDGDVESKILLSIYLSIYLLLAAAESSATSKLVST